MMENSEFDVERNEVVSINYTQPKFWHRVMANFIDFFLLIIAFLLLFIGVRSIVLNVPSYKATEQKIHDIQLASGLYVTDPNDTSKTVDVIYYLDRYVALYGGEFDGVGP